MYPCSHYETAFVFESAEVVNCLIPKMNQKT